MQELEKIQREVDDLATKLRVTAAAKIACTGGHAGMLEQIVITGTLAQTTIDLKKAEAKLKKHIADSALSEEQHKRGQAEAAERKEKLDAAEKTVSLEMEKSKKRGREELAAAVDLMFTNPAMTEPAEDASPEEISNFQRAKRAMTSWFSGADDKMDAAGSVAVICGGARATVNLGLEMTTGQFKDKIHEQFPDTNGQAIVITVLKARYIETGDLDTDKHDFDFRECVRTVTGKKAAPPEISGIINTKLDEENVLLTWTECDDKFLRCLVHVYEISVQAIRVRVSKAAVAAAVPADEEEEGAVEKQVKKVEKKVKKERKDRRTAARGGEESEAGMSDESFVNKIMIELENWAKHNNDMVENKLNKLDQRIKFSTMSAPALRGELSLMGITPPTKFNKYQLVEAAMDRWVPCPAPCQRPAPLPASASHL